MSLYDLIYYILIIDLSSRSGTELCAHPVPRRGGPTIGHDSKAGQRPDIKRDQPTPALADGGEARLNRCSGAVAALARSARLRCRRSRQASVRELTDWLRCLTRSRQRPFPLHTRNPLNPDGRRKPIVLGTAVVRRVRSCAPGARDAKAQKRQRRRLPPNPEEPAALVIAIFIGPPRENDRPKSFQDGERILTEEAPKSSPWDATSAETRRHPAY